MAKSTVYLIPAPLASDGLNAIPPYVIDAVKQCNVFYVEQERTARRYLKSVWKEMVIDDYKWFLIDKRDESLSSQFRNDIKSGQTIGIISEAGCPGVADPGQHLVAIAQEMNAMVKPLVGPSSILLALMASGMNGQHFRFHGYLPVDQSLREKAILKLEADSARENCTQIFIETPYRNNQMLGSLLKVCATSTNLCVALDITSAGEFIKTDSVLEWKKRQIDLHKKPVIFLMLASKGS
jgi:16S rRNA (cytidine1402-2'-O)-methyltransferase